MSILNEQPKASMSKLLGFLRNKRMRTGIAILYTGILLLTIDIIYNQRLFASKEILIEIFKFTPYIIIVTGVGYILISYLEGNRITRSPNHAFSSNPPLERMIEELKYFIEEQRHRTERRENETQERFNELGKQLDDLNNLRFDNNQKSELFNSLKQSFTENVNNDFFVQLNENISIELTKEKRSRLDSLLKEFNSIKLRLNSEIDKLSRRANVNLVIGSLTTIVALITLGLLFSSQHNLSKVILT
jgi:prefoldin subunit 5